jgi:hypothetical protein
MDEPEEILELMRQIGRAVRDALPEGYGFALLMFEFREGGSMHYMSNGTRPEMVKALRETADKVEAAGEAQYVEVDR